MRQLTRHPSPKPAPAKAGGWDRLPRHPSGGWDRRRPSLSSGDERGQSTVEFALLLPMVILVLLAIVQVALVARDQIALTQAARETARQSAVDPDIGRAQAAGHNINPSADLHVDRPSKIGESLTVHASQHLVTSVPLVGALFPDVDLTARAVMRVEK